MDNFYEQFLTTDYGSKQKNLEIISKIFIILALIVSVFTKVIVSIVCLVIYFIIQLIGRFLFLEYEYELTEDELVISKIMNKKKRKVLVKINVNNIVNVCNGKNIKYRQEKIITACLKNSGLNEQVIFIPKNSEVIGFKVTMDDKLISMCKRINLSAFSEI